MSQIDFVELSKTVSHALRHEPWLYELELDDEGWAPVDVLLEAMRQERPEWAELGTTDLEAMIASSSKRRHEIVGTKIRAIYGHSVPGRFLKRSAAPPEILYHGTSPSVVASIRQRGLLPMKRQYVHLSPDLATATRVGKRKAANATILRVLASQAHAAGVSFFEGNDKVWLADAIPPKFVVFDEPMR
jgi:putative RNA 2'-phosphotransferase